jgi:hypothetical protein
MKLKDLQGPLEDAIERMLERPDCLQPFVVVETIPKMMFVQFVGSMERPLRFECPPMGFAGEFCLQGEKSPVKIDELPCMAAAYAVSFMLRYLGLEEDTEVSLEENPSPKMAS